MTREEAKRRAELYSALANGKTIQYKADHGEWTDLKTDLMCGIAESFRYRIKPKYRPFKTQEECWQEMLKHEPFGWVVTKNTDAYVHIRSVCGEYAGQPPKVVFEYGEPCFTFEQNFKIYNFADVTPFGINVK